MKNIENYKKSSFIKDWHIVLKLFISVEWEFYELLSNKTSKFLFCSVLYTLLEH